MTFDSFIELLTVLNGQDARIKYLERKLERERCATKKQYDKWLDEAEKEIRKWKRKAKWYKEVLETYGYNVIDRDGGDVE